jgi:DNA (cytosine-5)-methyltransferase 1
MTRPRLLDLFCGAGGAAVGYHRAGFEVVGVDIKPQPHYPFEFHRADAMELLPWLDDYSERFVAMHASPPCQAYAGVTAWRGSRDAHPRLIAPVRQHLAATGRPWVIENVPDARRELIHPVMLCGSMFGIPVRSHRYFEMPWLTGAVLLPRCCHQRGEHPRDHGGTYPESEFGPAMGIDWMTVDEARQAIPPAYTEWIGARLMEAIRPT